MLVNLLQNMLAVLLELRMLDTLCLLGYRRLHLRVPAQEAFLLAQSQDRANQGETFASMFDCYVYVDVDTT